MALIDGFKGDEDLSVRGYRLFLPLFIPTPSPPPFLVPELSPCRDTRPGFFPFKRHDDSIRARATTIFPFLISAKVFSQVLLY